MRTRPLAVFLTRVHDQQLARLPDWEVVRAEAVAELPEEVRRRCRVVVLRSEARLHDPQLGRLPVLTDVIRPGSGTDNIAVGTLARRGIALHRNADVSAEAVAELALCALTMLCRQMPAGHGRMLAGEYVKHLLIGESPRRQRVAIWGAGPVGRAVYVEAVRLGIGSYFVAHPSVPDTLPVVDQATAMASADVHVLAVPKRPTTIGLVDRGWIDRARRCRPYVINVGRLEVLDLVAVAEALRQGRLRGCHIDPVNAEHLDEIGAFLARTAGCNVSVTQHQGAQRDDIRERLDRWAIDTIRGLPNPVGVS